MSTSTRLLVRIAQTVAFAAILAAIASAQSPTRAESAKSEQAKSDQKVDQCVACHMDLEGRLGDPVKLWQGDIHQQRGLSCANCHGGDPTQEKRKAAMDPAKGFVAHPKHADIPRLCGKCHSDAAFMKRFNPAQRVDQESEYSSSVHGKRLKMGDDKVAVCTNCHGFHGVKAVGNVASPVYPLHVAETCGQCHANAEYMKPYGIPTDQLEKWKKSVHADALLKKQDLSAPTCNDCHGNHGATPPGIASVANVCGTCHVRQSDLFQKSPHAKPFERAGFAACVQCHSNHEIAHPTDALLSGKTAVCTDCHFEGTSGFKAAQGMHDRISGLAGQIDQARKLLAEAANDGMEVSGFQYNLREANNQLINARVVVHAFNSAQVDAAVKPGFEVAKTAHQGGLKALADFQFRRGGLAVSLVVIGIAIAALFLKLREIEKRQAQG